MSLTRRQWMEIAAAAALSPAVPARGAEARGDEPTPAPIAALQPMTDGALPIATEEHRGAFSLRLSARGIDVERARRGGQLTLMDAGETLRQFMVGAMPDRRRFMEIMGSVIDGNGRGSLPRLRGRRTLLARS